jgi:hypothetical protein
MTETRRFETIPIMTNTLLRMNLVSCLANTARSYRGLLSIHKVGSHYHINTANTKSGVPSDSSSFLQHKQTAVVLIRFLD